jgi:hypothetical protein
LKPSSGQRKRKNNVIFFLIQHNGLCIFVIEFHAERGHQSLRATFKNVYIFDSIVDTVVKYNGRASPNCPAFMFAWGGLALTEEGLVPFYGTRWGHYRGTMMPPYSLTIPQGRERGRIAP